MEFQEDIMSESCNQKCSSCATSCSGRTAPNDFAVGLHQMSQVKSVIGIVSGKGGVGKSMVTSMMAVLSQRKGLRTAILDADMTGPSIPKAFGVNDVRAEAMGHAILPVKTKTGIEVMSVNVLLDDNQDPVVWRGPVVASAVKQFWSDVIWDEIDTMFIDMPPGTGDVPLTVFQSLPVNGIIIVTSPQELVSTVVTKAVRMAEMMNIPILGLVENYAWFECPDCGGRHAIYGESHVAEVAAEHRIAHVAHIPIVPSIAALADQGKIEEFEGHWLDSMSEWVATVAIAAGAGSNVKVDKGE